MATPDFVIIGSGVSGGRIAYDLTAAGARCLLLEAGHEFNAETFPEDEIDYSTQMFWGGGLEINTGGDIGFLRAKCLGGSSIVNQALLDRFDDLAWDDWKARSGVPFFSVKDMEPHYAECEKTISIKQIPVQHYSQNAKIFRQALENLGYQWKPLERAEAECAHDHGSDCIVCLGGCPRDSKQSSLVTTIRKAREKGLRVESDFEVHHLDWSNDSVRVVGTQRGAKAEAAAPKVVLAAGAIGNSAILLRSNIAASLPALGKSFCCHPQYMTYAMFVEPVDAHKGAFQAIKSQDLKIRQRGYKFENVYAPPVGTAMIMPGYGRRHIQLMSRYRYYASMEIAVRDEPTGRITLGSGDRVKIQKSFTRQDRSRVAEGLNLVRDLFASLRPLKIVQCDQAFGLHLMGGCPIGTDPARSVVDPEFRVHGHGNIFAADSSVFPEAPGINPSFSIMALSHRAAQGMARA